MKTLIIIAIIGIFGCVATQPSVCPPEDVIINTPYGPLSVGKGQMIPENYYTIPEWKALMEEYYKEMEDLYNSSVPKENL